MRLVLGFGIAACCVTPTLAQDAPAASPQIVESLTLGYTTAITYSDTLTCSKSIDMLTPERSTRTVVTGAVEIECRVDDNGKPNTCSIRSEAPAGFGFAAAAILMAQRCKLNSPPLAPTTMDFNFTFQTQQAH